MLKRQLLRQAGACHRVRAFPCSLLTLGSVVAPRPSTTSRPAALATSISRQIIARGFSGAAAEAEGQNGQGQNGQGQNGQGQSGQITRFSDLTSIGVHPNILRAIVNDMRYENMTDVQAASINPALQGKDIVAQARTGTGKTLGFLLPTLQRIIQSNPELASRSLKQARSDDIRAIIISPTRELAEQIGVEARKLCRHTGIKVQTAVGGMNKGMMLRRTKSEGCHLLIATPGRLLDLLSDDYSGIDAPQLASLVLDEADRMLDVGFEQELRQIVRLLPDRRSKPRQIMLFSATIPKNVVQIARVYVDASNFQFVQTINPDEAPTHEKVPQHIVPVPGFEHFIPTLLEIMENAQKGEYGPDPFKAIAFFNHTDVVKMMQYVFEYLERSMRNLPPTYHIHSGLDQRQRSRAADLFRRAQSAILISTDVTARGMDFPNVTHVIQFGVPPSRDQYIHRLGRTGRANKSGQGWIIMRKDEVPDARRVLPGLPIKRHDGLQCAAVDTKLTKADALPPVFSQISNAMRRVPQSAKQLAYIKWVCDKNRQNLQETVDAANWWTEFQCGMSTPPVVPRRLQQAVGHIGRVTGITWEDGARRDDQRQGFGSGDRGGGRGFGGRDSRASRDPFDQMSSSRGGGRARRPEPAAF